MMQNVNSDKKCGTVDSSVSCGNMFTKVTTEIQFQQKKKISTQQIFDCPQYVTWTINLRETQYIKCMIGQKTNF